MQPIITLTTDFGTRDSYVGIMKGVIMRLCPNAQIIDITHEIEPQNITAASLMVESYVPYFPDGTIHVIVVDPGVGSTRHPMVVATPQAFFVGPDNGVFGQVWQQARQQWAPRDVRAIALTETRYWLPQVSNTFHGRDIFAPVAAHLANGVNFSDLGMPLLQIVTLPIPEPEFQSQPERLIGHVLMVDHFGNCTTSITLEHLFQLVSNTHLISAYADPSALQDIRVVVCDNRGNPLPFVAAPLPISNTYADVTDGETLTLIGSTQRLEIAVRNGSAASVLGIGVGSIVQITLI